MTGEKKQDNETNWCKFVLEDKRKKLKRENTPTSNAWGGSKPTRNRGNHRISIVKQKSHFGFLVLDFVTTWKKAIGVYYKMIIKTGNCNGDRIALSQ